MKRAASISRSRRSAARRSTRAERRATTLADRALLIFTSGTTGLPKAAAVSHHRVVAWSHWFAGLADMRADDRMYDCLPLCHSVGGVAALAAALVNGGSVVIAETFSASRFWSEVARWDCTIFQYIGELCRYLVAAPTSAAEKAHRLRLACGNGLSADVWRAFAERFGVPQILEFYASTEGNLTLYNVEGKVGAIGRQPPFLAARDAIALARFDSERKRRGAGRTASARAAASTRSAKRWAALAARPASASRATPSRRKRRRRSCATSSRPATRGCAPATSCAATARASTISSTASATRSAGRARTWRRARSPPRFGRAPGVREAVVYGVVVPNADGKAGMAALTIDGAPDLEAIARAASALPRYARPLFLRLTPALEATATFKPLRRALVAEGFDPVRRRRSALRLRRGAPRPMSRSTPSATPRSRAATRGYKGSDLPSPQPSPASGRGGIPFSRLRAEGGCEAAG